MPTRAAGRTDAVNIAHEIVLWTTPDKAVGLLVSDLTQLAAVVAVASEADAWAQMPPRKNARLYLIDVAACHDATPGFVAAVAARAASWPPFVVFGDDPRAVMASPLLPNSRIVVTPETIVELLTTAADYWVRVNQAMRLE